MTTNPRGRRAFLAGVLGGLAAFATAGCSDGPVHTPVNAGKARDTLRTALESWKKGDPANALESGSPPIYIIDPEWQGGAQLTAYEILGDGEEKDAHLYCKVRLTVRTKGGKEARQEVTFIVSTAPNLTVSRKLF